MRLYFSSDDAVWDCAFVLQVSLPVFNSRSSSSLQLPVFDSLTVSTCVSRALLRAPSLHFSVWTVSSLVVLSEFRVLDSVNFKLLVLSLLSCLPQSSVLLPPSADRWATVVCFQHWFWSTLNYFSWGEFRCFQSICWTVGKPLMPPPSSPVKPQTCFSFVEDCFSVFVPSVKSKATFIRRTKSCVLSAELQPLFQSF